MICTCVSVPDPEGYEYVFPDRPAEADKERANKYRAGAIYAITKGKSYRVLALSVDTNGQPYYFVKSDLSVSGIPSTWAVLVPASHFDIQDRSVDSAWHVFPEQSPFVLSLCPMDWGPLSEFKTKLNDASPEAIKSFLHHAEPLLKGQPGDS